MVLILTVLIFSGCGSSYDYVKINSSAEYEQETIFLQSLLVESEQLQALKLKLIREEGESGTPVIAIDFFFTMGTKQETVQEHILISSSVLVPREDALAARTGTSLAACLDGKETLIPPTGIAPPFVALRVDGLALDDEAYPLIRKVWIELRTEGNKKPSGKLIKKLPVLWEFLESTPKHLLLPKPEPIWIAAGGDLMLDRGASLILLREGPEGIFGKTAETLASSDLSLVNLECVISSRGEKVQKSFNFRSDPEIAPTLRDAGINAVLHANNHVYDYGGIAFLDSLSWLDKAGIGVVGAGTDDEAASEPFIFNRGDEIFRVFGLASFPRERNGWDGVSAAAGPDRPGMLHSGRNGAEKLKAKIATGGDRAFNIILFHGGVEWSTRPDASTRALYTGLVEAGADLIIGSHPHIVQGFEWIMEKPVFWSLGNYVFGGMENTDGGEEGLFIRLGFLDGRLLYLEPFALTLTHTRTDISPPEKLETFYARSRELQSCGK
ncbi:MAG: CapA family protein [Treponema sp.]|nr:CapA family protein [Treponema sp.]